MVKIPLNQKITDIKGKPLMQPDPETKKLKEILVRDYLLLVLSTRFTIVDRKEIFWTTGLGLLFADDKNKEVEISDDKAKFLQRIIENNKVKQNLPMGGEREIELFSPLELGQMLSMFEKEEKK